MVNEEIWNIKYLKECIKRLNTHLCSDNMFRTLVLKLYILEKIMVNHDLGNIEPIEIQKEMSSSYLDYAMSVIVSRALPDV